MPHDEDLRHGAVSEEIAVVITKKCAEFLLQHERYQPPASRALPGQ